MFALTEIKGVGPDLNILEMRLIEIVFFLLTEHSEANHFPAFDLPRWPKNKGYTHAHKTRDFEAVGYVSKERGRCRQVPER